jgi:segregation and condensation protein A
MSDTPEAEAPVDDPVFNLTMPAAAGEAFIVDVDGFEGPLDLLLTLARSQKVDLRRISIVRLVDQYLAFIAHLAKADLDLAADYLVMASWLAYLKSRLLLPRPEKVNGELSGEEMAARLAFRLQRLQAMREAGGRLMARDRLGRDVFFRGEPQGIRVVKTPAWSDTIFDLLRAYADQRKRVLGSRLSVKRAPVYAIDEARKRLEQLIGMAMDWRVLDSFLPDLPQFRAMRRSTLASTLSASLEMAKDGKLQLHQADAFGPVFLRSPRPEAANDHAPLDQVTQ